VYCLWSDMGSVGRSCWRIRYWSRSQQKQMPGM